MIRLKPEILDLIKDSHGIQGLLADKLDVIPITIGRWIQDNHIMLTTADALEIISRELGRTRNEILVGITDVNVEVTNLSPTSKTS